MKQNYFIYNDKKYYSGTVIEMQRYDWKLKRTQIQEMIFIYRDPEIQKYLLKTNYDCDLDLYSYQEFNDKLITITNKINIDRIRIEYEWHFPKHTLNKELKIDGMFIAWVWYVFIMLLLVIFNGRILGWILVTFIFTKYRNEKLRKVDLKK